MSWDGLDWTVMTVAAAIATAVATTASVFLSMLWRLVDRERAEWVTFHERSSWSEAEEHGLPEQHEPRAEASLANIGRGPALAVRAAGIGCRVTIREEDHRAGDILPTLIPALTTGQTILLTAVCEPDDWARARVAITWTASPRLLRKRRLRMIPLSQIAARPVYYGRPDPDKGWRSAPMPEPPGPHLPELRPDHPLPPPRTDLREWLRWRRALLRG